MSDIAPYLITPSEGVELPAVFLLPVVTTRERWDYFISALMVGAEVVYSENEILPLVDVLDAIAEIREETEIVSYPSVFSKTSEDFEVIFGSVQRVISSAIPFNGGRYMNQQNAAIVFYVDVPSGSNLSLRILISKANNMGVVTAYWDGDLIGTYDAYQSTTNYANEWTMNVPNPSQGLHALSFQSNSKNVSSAGYAMLIWHIYGRVST